MSDVVLSLDLGTGGCKAALVDRDAVVRAETVSGYVTSYPEPGRHEQRPSDWWTAVRTAAHELLDATEHHVIAVGISGHSLAMVPIDADGNLLTERVPIWSDIRGEDAAARCFGAAANAEDAENTWYERTGNGFPRGMYTVFKAARLRETQPEIASGVSTVLGSKDWINLQLCGARRTDHSYASGSGCYDLRARTFAPELSAAAGVPIEWWPPIVASTEVVGSVSADAAEQTGIPAGVPVVCGGVDNSCMALGAGLDADGRSYLSLGSSNWYSLASTDPVLNPVTRPFVFDHVLPDLYISALSTFAGGSSLEWFAELTANADGLTGLLAQAADSPVGARGLSCVPTLAGGTVLEGGPEVRGTFLGLDLTHTQGDLVRAMIEGVGFSLADAATLMSHSYAADAITAIGGGARSELMLQVLADLLERTIVRPHAEQHGAALGAASLAWLGIGSWDDTQPLHSAREIALRVEPRPDPGYALARTRFDAARTAVTMFADAPTRAAEQQNPGTEARS